MKTFMDQNKTSNLDIIQYHDLFLIVVKGRTKTSSQKRIIGWVKREKIER